MRVGVFVFRVIASDPLLQKIYLKTIPTFLLSLIYEYQPYLTARHVIALIDQLFAYYPRRRILANALTEVEVRIFMPLVDDFYQEHCLELYACVRKLTVDELKTVVR